MPELDRDGHFRVRVVEWTLRENDKTGSVNLAIRFVVLEQYMGDEGWASWESYEEHEVWGNYNILKKDQSLNETTIRQLMEGIDWDGDFDRLTGGKPFEPRYCQVRVAPETYEGVTRFRAGWMSAWESVPGARGIDPERGVALGSQYGSQLRAIASNVKRDAAKPTGTPGPPPPPPPESPPPTQAAVTAQAPPPGPPPNLTTPAKAKGPDWIPF